MKDALVEHIAALLNIDRRDIRDAQWADNGPGWVAVLLEDAEAVLALRPSPVDLDLGVVGPYPAGAAEAFEVRAFFPKDGARPRGTRAHRPRPRRNHLGRRRDDHMC